MGHESPPGHPPAQLVRAGAVMSTPGSQRCAKVTQAAQAVTFEGLLLQSEG